MSRFPAIRGFQSAIVVIMLTYAVIAVLVTLTHSISVEASPSFAEPVDGWSTYDSTQPKVEDGSFGFGF